MSRPRSKSRAYLLSRLAVLIVTTAVAAIPLTSALGLQHKNLAVRLTPQLEVVVVESTDCLYCVAFRRNVLSSYEESACAREAPLRFLDLDDVTTRRVVLAEPIFVVPTVLVLRDNEEVGRIPGYVAWDDFFRSVNYLLARVR